MNIPVYYVTYGDMDVLSLVEFPAIEETFQMFSMTKEFSFSLDEEKHIVFGPAMIPDRKIYRNSPEGNPYYIVFTKEVIEQMVNKAAKDGHTLNISLEHNGQSLSSCYVVSSFLSSEYLQPTNCPNFPLGTWFVGVKIEDPQIWQDIKDGKFTGFSIEALCNIETTEADPLDEAINNILD